MANLLSSGRPSGGRGRRERGHDVRRGRRSLLFLLRMVDGVVDYVAYVGVDELVSDLAASPGGRDQPGPTEHLQVLGQQWLAHYSPCGLQGALQLVDAAGADGQFDHHGQADRRGQCLEELDCSGQSVSRGLRTAHLSTLESTYIKSKLCHLGRRQSTWVRICNDCRYCLAYLQPIPTTPARLPGDHPVGPSRAERGIGRRTD